MVGIVKFLSSIIQVGSKCKKVVALLNNLLESAMLGSISGEVLQEIKHL